MPVVDVVVAITTYRRPEGIRRILPEVVAQAQALARPASVLVVDNDPAGGAAEFVREWASSGVRYVHEPRPGIAAARNRALDESQSATVLVFIDDDEIPSDGWLRQLVEAWSAWQCSAVAGPVRSKFERPPSGWVLASGVFDTAVRPSGTVLAGAATNNLLLNLDDLRRFHARFDEQFGMTGGEDTRLIHGLIKSGGVIRWCAEAEVVEFVPADRLTRSWVIKRRLRTSNSWSRVVLDLAGSPAKRFTTRANLTLRGFARAGRGTIGIIRGAVGRDVGRRSRSTIELVNAVGMVLGAYGYVSGEYRRTQTGSTTRAQG